MKVWLAILLFMATPVFGEIYTWTDGRGTAHYTNREDDIPSAYRKKAKQLNYGAEPQQGQVSRPAAGTASPAATGLPAGRTSPGESAGPGTERVREQREERQDRMKGNGAVHPRRAE